MNSSGAPTIAPNKLPPKARWPAAGESAPPATSTLSTRLSDALYWGRLAKPTFTMPRDAVSYKLVKSPKWLGIGVSFAPLARQSLCNAAAEQPRPRTRPPTRAHSTSARGIARTVTAVIIISKRTQVYVFSVGTTST